MVAHLSAQASIIPDHGRAADGSRRGSEFRRRRAVRRDPVRRRGERTPRHREAPMKYLLMIYGDESGWDQVTPEEGQAIMNAYWAFGAEVEASGAFVAGEGLQPTG